MFLRMVSRKIGFVSCTGRALSFRDYISSEESGLNGKDMLKALETHTYIHTHLWSQESLIVPADGKKQYIALDEV